MFDRSTTFQRGLAIHMRDTTLSCYRPGDVDHFAAPLSPWPKRIFGMLGAASACWLVWCVALWVTG